MSRRKLSQRQIGRIANIQERRRQKLASRAHQALQEGDGNPEREGLVVARHGANIAVNDEHGQPHHCLSRQNIGHPVCGDRVVWKPTGGGQGVITALLERDSVLSRPDYSGRDKPLAANISLIVIVLAPQPEPSDYLLDQYLVAAEHIGVRSLIALNKIDLVEGGQERVFMDRFEHYRRIGYPIVPVSAHREHGLDRVVHALHDETSILVGQSGVGKSSLIQTLLPDLGIQIGRLSKATGLGRHTTSTATWYRLPGGGSMIDSPGVRSFRLGKLDFLQLQLGFREVRPYVGSCRFANCRHEQEPGCAIKHAVSTGEIAPQRLDNLRHMAMRLESQ